MAPLTAIDGFGLARPELFWVALATGAVLVVLRERSRADHAPSASFLGTLLRAVALAAIFLALARPWTERLVPDRALVVAVDRSASLGPRGLERADLSARQIEAQRSGELLSFVVSGERLAVGASWDLGLAAAGTAAPEAGTDLGTLLDQAVAALPAARRREIVLLSDGIDSRSAWLDAARVAEVRDVAIHAVDLSDVPQGAALVQLEAPSETKAGQPIEVRASGVLHGPGGASIRLTGPGGVEHRAQIDTVGAFDVALPFTPTTPGTQEVVVRVEAEVDDQPWDDERRHRLHVPGPPRALVVGAGEGAKKLERALAVLDGGPLVERAAALPAPPYDDHRMMILVDPALPDVGPERGKALVSWVRGGGRLFVTGGSAGLVTDEPGAKDLAEVLPVRFPKTKKEQRAPLTVVFLLDRSDSMAGGPKFEMAATALVQSASALPPGARLGVLAFADFPEWIWPVQAFAGAGPVLEALQKVPVKGGTSIYPAIDAAVAALADDPALVRHVVLLSDGQSTTRFTRSGDAVRIAAQRSITVTTVSVGAESDRGEMEAIARAGLGRAHHAERFSELPKLFLDEMMQVQRTNKVEEPVGVLAVQGATMLRRLPPGESIPPVAGYVQGEQRGGTDLALATAEGFPLLVSGHHGRGRVGLFTSDVGGPWTENWRSWGQEGALWTGVLQSLLDSPPAPRARATAHVREAEALLAYEIEDSMGNPSNGLIVEARIDDERGHRTVELPPTGPGRYGALLRLNGATLFRVAPVGVRPGTAQGLPPVGESACNAWPDPPIELTLRDGGRTVLETITSRTRGRLDPDLDALLAEPAAERIERTERWREALFVGLVALAMDLLARRLRPWRRPSVA